MTREKDYKLLLIVSIVNDEKLCFLYVINLGADGWVEGT